MVTQQNGQVVTVGGAEVEVACRGSGEPLVYLHGAFGYRGWHPFMDALADNFTVYAPIQPGFVDNAPGPDDIDDLLDLTLYHFDLLESLGLEAPNVVGHFLGGMIAAEMAALRPSSVGKLVMAAPAGIWLEDDPGIDYFATPMEELRGILFAEPNSDAAKSVMPEPSDDLERGTQILERGALAGDCGQVPLADTGQGTEEADASYRCADTGRHWRTGQDCAGVLWRRVCKPHRGSIGADDSGRGAHAYDRTAG